jgi:hypothetical protein
MIVKTENIGDLEKIMTIAQSAGHHAHIRDGAAHIEGPARRGHRLAGRLGFCRYWHSWR